MLNLRRALLAAGSASLIAGSLTLTLTTPASAGGGGTPDLIGNTEDEIFTFSSSSPGSVTEIPLTGAPAESVLLAIDVRPSTQVLYGLFVTGDDFYAVAPINPTTGAVGAVVVLTNAVGGAQFPADFENAVGIDFNPVADRLRIVTEEDENLRANVDTGVTNVDTPVSGMPQAGEDQCVVGAAYTNSTPGPAPASTQLFDIVDDNCFDGDADQLAIQSPPNEGTLTPVGELGFESEFEAGFEISPTGIAYLASRTNGPEPTPGLAARPAGKAAFGGAVPLRLATVDLATGAATVVGIIGDGFAGEFVDGLTSFPVQVPVVTTTTTALATTSTTAAVRSSTTVLARTGDEETAQGALGIALVAGGAAALLFGARLRRRSAA